MDDSVCVRARAYVRTRVCDLMGVHFHGFPGWMYFYTHSHDDIAVRIIKHSSHTLVLIHKTHSFIYLKVLKSNYNNAPQII